MAQHKGLVATALVAILAAACSSSSASPSASSAPASQPPASQAPASEAAASVAPPSEAPAASIGPGEGELDLVAWVGYVEDGSNVPEYDWVKPFIAANPDCSKVTVKTADTSDEMYTLMSQGHGTV